MHAYKLCLNFYLIALIKYLVKHVLEKNAHKGFNAEKYRKLNFVNKLIENNNLTLKYFYDLKCLYRVLKYISKALIQKID